MTPKHLQMEARGHEKQLQKPYQKTAWNTTAFSWFLVANGSPKRPQNLSFFCSGIPLGHTLALKWPRWQPRADFASKYTAFSNILSDVWLVSGWFWMTVLEVIMKQTRLSYSWQMTFKIPSKSPQLPKRTKTSRCGGVASAFSICNIVIKLFQNFICRSLFNVFKVFRKGGDGLRRPIN